MQTQYSVLDYKVDLHFNDYKLAREIDENGHKVLGQELGCKFIKIDPGKDFLIFLKLSLKYLDTSNNCLIN